MSKLSFAKQIALRYLWSKRSEAFITIITIISVIGVAVGVMVINIVMAVMTGFESELREKIVGTNSHIVIRHISGRIQNWEEAAKTAGAVPGVESVSPFTYHQALIKAGSGSTGVLIRGIKESTSAAAQLAKFLKDGQKIESLFNPPPPDSDLSGAVEERGNLPGIVIGKELARSLGLFVGMPVSLLAPNVTSSPFGLMPKFRRFVVAGTYSSGLVEYESGLAYVPLQAAQNFFRTNGAVTGLEVRTKDFNKSSDTARAIYDALGGPESGIIVQDWTQSNMPLWEAMKLEKRVYFIVLLLIIVMASFSIVSSLIMIVLEKRKDIAVLKTFGASSKSIGNIFRIQGAVIGGMGTLIGLVLSFIGCIALKEYGFPIDERIFQMSTVPVKIDIVNFIVVALAAFFICFVATFYPARRASGLEPTELLRHE